MVSAWRNFKNIFSRPLFTIIFRPEMLKFYPYSILTGERMAGLVIFCVLKVSKSQKQIMTLWILPKKRMKRTQDTILSVFRSFFGRINDALIYFRDLVTFSYSLVCTLRNLPWLTKTWKKLFSYFKCHSNMWESHMYANTYIHFCQTSCSRDLNMVVKLHSELHF